MRHLIKIKEWFYFKRRIPNNVKNHYANKEMIQVSLKTTCEAVAIQRAMILNEELKTIWEFLLINHTSNKDHSLHNAIEIAQSYNFTYRPIKELADTDLEKIISRVKVLKAEPLEDKKTVSALLGTAKVPTNHLSNSLEEYFQFERPNHTRKSKDQFRKWKNPKIRAVNNFTSVCGDISVSKITRNEILAFRSWWFDRVESENLSPNSPNKDFTHLRGVIQFTVDNNNLDICVDSLFSRIRFKEIKSTRPPFSIEFIKTSLLKPTNLKDLDSECQLFLYAMADLGARPSEIVGLNAKNGDIRLDTDIPFIHIRQDKDREIKTPQSERILPLVGASLYAFQQLSNGFDKYYRKPDQLSGNLNKYLRNNQLLPTEEHSVYSLRHSFEDRLTSVEPPDKVQAALMGHRYERPRYGDGPSLEQKHKWMNMIAIDVRDIL